MPESPSCQNPSLFSHIFDKLCLSEGTEIIEFAVCLPLLVVLVVGIYDFGSAFTLKHKLTSAVREGVRVASNQQHPANPAANGGCGVPSSICVVRDVVHSSLLAGNIYDCNLGTVSGANIPSGKSTWTFTGSCSGLTLQVDRGLLNPATASLVSPFDTRPYVVENTKVTLSYPYQWQFNRAFKLLSPTSNYLGSTITVSATMQNID
jgi:hypothetical protein